jgi:hypothetical protein
MCMLRNAIFDPYSVAVTNPVCCLLYYMQDRRGNIARDVKAITGEQIETAVL